MTSLHPKHSTRNGAQHQRPQSPPVRECWFFQSPKSRAGSALGTREGCSFGRHWHCPAGGPVGMARHSTAYHGHGTPRIAAKRKVVAGGGRGEGVTEERRTSSLDNVRGHTGSLHAARSLALQLAAHRSRPPNRPPLSPSKPPTALVLQTAHRSRPPNRPPLSPSKPPTALALQTAHRSRPPNRPSLSPPNRPPLSPSKPPTALALQTAHRSRPPNRPPLSPSKPPTALALQTAHRSRPPNRPPLSPSKPPTALALQTAHRSRPPNHPPLSPSKPPTALALQTAHRSRNPRNLPLFSCPLPSPSNSLTSLTHLSPTPLAHLFPRLSRPHREVDISSEEHESFHYTKQLPDD
ncbi:leucine-rich repeat extensin-like protein 3 [Penaeus chinensis]|uniref:leucine-rich repeat extensin-like protein 3 n=1 Tax=Penaeus chinensis TaxID=139456 RepID=UPI001FB73E05|nr:leucine-rich repeat extensin-like protein 3 [Penaeus chinensis]